MCLILNKIILINSGEVVTTRDSVGLLFDACVKDSYALVGFFEGNAARIWGEKSQEVSTNIFIYIF